MVTVRSLHESFSAVRQPAGLSPRTRPAGPCKTHLKAPGARSVSRPNLSTGGRHSALKMSYSTVVSTHHFRPLVISFSH